MGIFLACGVTQRNRADNPVNIKADVETSLLEDVQLQHIVLQLGFAVNIKEGKMCLSYGRYITVASASTSLPVLQGSLS